MTTIQQTVVIAAPTSIAYQQLMRFEDYPRFMQDIESVRQLDATHLHWSAVMEDKPVEWDSEIVEQRVDNCLAWRNAGGPIQAGKIELTAIEPDSARVTITMEYALEKSPEAGAETGAETSGVSQATLERQLEHYLTEFKGIVESSAQSASLQDQQVGAQMPQTMQSANSLSQSSDDASEEGRFSVAEEMNFDQQSDDARQIGQMPRDIDAASIASAVIGTNPGQAIAESMKQSPEQTKAQTIMPESDPRDTKKRDQSIDRAVPPSV